MIDDYTDEEMDRMSCVINRVGDFLQIECMLHKLRPNDASLILIAILGRLCGREGIETLDADTIFNAVVTEMKEFFLENLEIGRKERKEAFGENNQSAN